VGEGLLGDEEGGILTVDQDEVEEREDKYGRGGGHDIRYGPEEGV